MCNNIECIALRDEVAELRRTLGLAGRLTDQRAIERTFGLNHSEARLALALYDAAGKVVPRLTLDSTVLRAESFEDGSDALKTIICRVRRKLGADTIDTAEGGYAVTHAGRALIASAFKIAEAA